jgi:hypothetical protein
MVFTSIEIHELLINQIGNNSEISDFRNDSAIISESRILHGQKGLIAIDNIPKHSIIFSYKNTVSHERTRTSIQVSADSHIEAGEYGIYVNHSCLPNTTIWTQTRENGVFGHVVLIALRDILKGEEISFDYATTEIELTPQLRGTACMCREFGCRRMLKGFADLTLRERNELFNSQRIAKHIAQNIHAFM